MTLDGDDYRKGALERMDDALILLRSSQYAGYASDADRAVEGILRAVIWKRDADVRRGKKSLETGHNLLDLLAHVRNLGLLALPVRSQEIEKKIERIAQLWFNNMRFVSTKFVESNWRKMGEIHRRRSIKQAMALFCYDCNIVLRYCEALCQK